MDRHRRLIIPLALAAIAGPFSARAAEPAAVPAPAPASPKSSSVSGPGEENFEVTFSEHIAPILYQNCAACHRPGESAPFTLTSYDDAKRKARTIQRVTQERYMPPWHPVEGHGVFKGERRLTDEQIALIDRWVKAGAPQGDPTREPALPDFPEGWTLGEPDVVLEMDESFQVHAEGRDIYRYFALPLGLKEDKWVRAVEVRPSARSVVHHVLFYLDNTGKARELDAADKKAPGFNGKGFKSTGSIGGWAVGGEPLELSPGYALPLPKGSDLVLQTHFHPSGKAESEKTKIGIYFAEEVPEQRLVEFQVPPRFGGKTGLNIAPGESNYVLKDHMIVPEDTDLITVWGHAHQLCRTIKGTATFPDGTTKPLFYIDDWDFDWQGQYEYREPFRLPKGTRVDVEITYDNSAENPDNPFSPPQRVRWGEQSDDEMGSLIFQAVAADKSKHGALVEGLKREDRASRERFADNLRNAIRMIYVLQLDKDKDDRLTRDEVPKEHLGAFVKLDHNQDGVVEPDDIVEHGAFLDKHIKD